MNFLLKVYLSFLRVKDCRSIFFCSDAKREGLNAAKKQLISKALATTNGNRSAAAKILGIEAKYLLRLMKSFHIK
jgi:DNA-binding NtrC family response regulator